MLGRVAGVGAQLKKIYPNIVIWHCCNHSTRYQHFTTAANDGLRTSKEKSKYLGLQRHLASIEFVTNLGIMYDALCELADLSTLLQNRSHTLTQANRCIQCRIMVLIQWLKIMVLEQKKLLIHVKNYHLKAFHSLVIKLYQR
ncbi:uncharacterized protein LOC126549135 isoform X2 [Aphis gossypii]|uniref:uncharacterized protein LOC126549135 isoform X2 n=1 Tax=Aphis gossypii TaxID=80765 RepID=UPI002158ECE7|nr:uncharacterized protein LOC126549135 isoform X2 [Aphis gossypii]